MSEGTPAETKIETNTDAEELKNDATPQKGKRGGKQSKSLTNLAKEAEAILKGFGDKEEVPEGRRATRSSTRGASAPVSTPPPVKKERKSASTASGGTDSAPRSTKRGRPKKLAGEDVKNDSANEEKQDVEMNDASAEPKENSVNDNNEEEKVNSSNSNVDEVDKKSTENAENRKPTDTPATVDDADKPKENAVENESTATKSPTTNGSASKDESSVDANENKGDVENSDSKPPTENENLIEKRPSSEDVSKPKELTTNDESANSKSETSTTNASSND